MTTCGRKKFIEKQQIMAPSKEICNLMGNKIIPILERVKRGFLKLWDSSEPELRAIFQNKKKA